MTNHRWIFSTWWLLAPALTLLAFAATFMFLHGRRLKLLAMLSLMVMAILLLLWPLSYLGRMTVSTDFARLHPDSFDQVSCGLDYEKGVIGGACHINRYQHTLHGGDDWKKIANSTSKLLPETSFFWDVTSVGPGTSDPIPTLKWSDWRVSPPWWAHFADGEYEAWKPPPTGHSGTLFDIHIHLRVWLLFFR